MLNNETMLVSAKYDSRQTLKEISIRQVLWTKNICMIYFIELYSMNDKIRKTNKIHNIGGIQFQAGFKTSITFLCYLIL